MLSYPFPPAASAAVFRTLRFVKYLPEFGWRPLVVTKRTDAAGRITVDRSLDGLVPPGTIVQRTGVLRPLVTAREVLSAILSLRPGAAGAEKKARSDADPPDASEGTPQRNRGFFRAAIEAFADLAAMPDEQVGWVLPAVASALRLVRRFRPRAIYSTGPPHSTHLIALALKWITGIPIVTDFRDPWARKTWGNADMRPWRAAIEARLERLCVCGSDRVILNTPGLRDEFSSVYESRLHAKFVVIPNGYDPDLLPRINELTKESSGHRNGAVHLCHAGTLYGRRGLRQLAAAVGRLWASGHNVTVEQVGQVDGRTQLLAYLREHALEDCVRLTEPLPHDQMLRRLAAADVLVVIQPGTRIQVPAKLYEMLMFRKPILALTDEGATGEIVEEFGLGEVAPPDDGERIASAILRLAHDLPKSQGNPGWDAAQRAFDGRELTRKLADTLNVLDRSAPRRV
jgi:glycosyltransferase involved in cell wall biosynthesis